jgi:hypothetical protein
VRKWWWWGGGGGGDDGGCRSGTTHVSTTAPRFLIGTTIVTCFCSLVLPFFGMEVAGMEVAGFWGLALTQDHTVRLNVSLPLHSREQHTGVEGGGQLPQGGNNLTEHTCSPARKFGARGKYDHTLTVFQVPRQFHPRSSVRVHVRALSQP